MQSGAHRLPRLKLERMTDEQLLDAVFRPKDGNYMTINTRTGLLVNGNGRAHELLRRANDAKSGIALDGIVPIIEYSPDVSMFVLD